MLVISNKYSNVNHTIKTAAEKGKMALQTLAALLTIGIITISSIMFRSKENYGGNKHDQFSLHLKI